MKCVLVLQSGDLGGASVVPCGAAEVEFIRVSAADSEWDIHGRELDLAIIDSDKTESELDGCLERLSEAGFRSSIILLTSVFTTENVMRLAIRGDLVLPKPLDQSAFHNIIDWMSLRRDPLLQFEREYRLSPREASLIRYSLQGNTNDEMANLLGCSRPTVATYWNRIFRKTQVRSQREVLALLLKFRGPVAPKGRVCAAGSLFRIPIHA